ncbi:hypothetical protein [Blastococcus goldschmidtiae]|uniref:Uncharacterized protein n=1 Tax=Blastococcus goldschmidtiae TaxID=3075546 RepID=A0ABU2K3I1_9ACTN|nr:hypothetical protein [Blastococcus sp. DSM 46792]MDT0274742.1 hypothetical protein [Blastococcus sp. DSM 46792]
MDMTTRPDRASAVHHQSVTGHRLPGRLRSRRELVVPPAQGTARG